ncbi:MAG: CYTH domain-containing protein [Gammaproteobacteria bacterium]|jgi:CYTH domain-containing protein
MPREIERKFLVKNKNWKSDEGMVYRQGYLSLDKERTVRVQSAGNEGYLTIKGITRGATRQEFEYEIPLAEANEILDTLCLQPLIEKHRYKIEYAGLTWEVDEFSGDNAGLVIAEVELESEEQAVDKPAWLGEKVTDDSRFYNASLVENPYRNWKV